MYNLSVTNHDTSQHIPKYFRIQQEVLENIRSGHWPPGSAIPSEAELCAQYQVSRGTIRRALDELDRRELITRSPGKPTVVNTPKIPLLASGFRTDIAKKGMHPDTQVLNIGLTKASLEIAQLLDIPHGTMIPLVQRIILADGVPIIVESAHVGRECDPITTDEVQNTSLLELIPTKCHTILTRAVESYEPILLSSEIAQALQCQVGDLGIKDQAIVFEVNNRPLYVSTAMVRGDKARIVTETLFQVADK